jgi:hypothetical protein
LRQGSSFGGYKEDATASVKKKKKLNGLPPQLALGARVEITHHCISSMAGARGVSLGTFTITTTPRKRALLAVKLAGPHRKGSTVDVDAVSTVTHHRQVCVFWWWRWSWLVCLGGLAPGRVVTPPPPPPPGRSHSFRVGCGQRAFAGTVDAKAEGPVAHVDVDDLHVLSAPEHPDPKKRTEVTKRLNGAAVDSTL